MEDRMPDVKKQRAGRKGGQTVSKNRDHMSAIGRKGGQRSRSNRAGAGRNTKAETSLNAVELIKSDHQRVKSLFEDYETSGGQDRAMIANKIMTELEVHAKIEEEIFYPAFRGKADEGDELVTEALEEHRTVKDLISDLQEMDGDDEAFQNKFQDLLQEVQHHVEEEESEMLPAAEDQLADQLDQLGTRMSERKEQLKTAETNR
jgi:hemerythrin superfamily protein